MTTRTKDGAFVALEFERIGQLTRQGYGKAPKGRPCRHCGAVGSVWIKSTRNGTSETAYCTACDVCHTVRVK